MSALGPVPLRQPGEPSRAFAGARTRRGARAAAAAAAGGGWLAAAALPGLEPARDGLVVGASLAAALATGIALRRADRHVEPAGLLLFAAFLAVVVRFGLLPLDADRGAGKALLYVAFLVAFALWLGINGVISNRQTHAEDLRHARSLSYQLLVYLGLVALLTASLFLLARFFSPTLCLLLLGAGALQIATAAALKSLEHSSRATVAREQWLGAELFAPHGPWVAGLLVLILLVVLAYPVAAGVVYFSSGVPDADLTVWVFRLTLVVAFIVHLPFAHVLLVTMLASARVEDRTRARVLVTTAGNLFWLGLMTALTFWAFGLASTDDQVRLGRLELEVSAPLVLTLVGYVVLAVLVPAGVGSRRWRRWHVGMLRREEDWVAAAGRALDAPDGAREPALGRLVEALREERRRLEREHAAVTGGPPPHAGPSLVATYAFIREHAADPRLRHLDRLERLEETAASIARALGAAGTERARRELAADWSRRLLDVGARLAEDAREAGRLRVPGWVPLGSLAAPLVGIALDQFGGWIWAQVGGSLPT